MFNALKIPSRLMSLERGYPGRKPVGSVRHIDPAVRGVWFDFTKHNPITGEPVILTANGSITTGRNLLTSGSSEAAQLDSAARADLWPTTKPFTWVIKLKTPPIPSAGTEYWLLANVSLNATNYVTTYLRSDGSKYSLRSYISGTYLAGGALGGGGYVFDPDEDLTVVLTRDANGLCELYGDGVLTDSTTKTDSIYNRHGTYYHRLSEKGGACNYELVKISHRHTPYEEVLQIQDDPYRGLEPQWDVDTLLLRPSATSEILLAGNTTAVATVTGDLSTGVQLSGDNTAVATVTGDLSTGVQLSGDTTAVATVTGDLLAGGAELSGNTTAVSTVTGDLSTGVQLSGEANGIATLIGNLVIPGEILLEGDATGTALLSGDLSVGSQFTGIVAGIATLLGDLNSTELFEEIITMAADSQGKKKSDFPALDNIPSDATFDFVSGGANYKIPVADFLTSLNVTGTIVQDGSATGVPILDPHGTESRIRNLEAGPGISASVSGENGVALQHNFQNGSGGVAIIEDPEATSPTVVNLVAGTGITLTPVAGGIVISLT